jgi:hypothetical protein
MHTRNWLLPLYGAEVLKVFRHPQNRRRSLPARQKPVVRKLVGCDTWVCHMRHTGAQQPGFGLTPTQAYNDWKRNQQC